MGITVEIFGLHMLICSNKTTEAEIKQSTRDEKEKLEKLRKKVKSLESFLKYFFFFSMD